MAVRFYDDALYEKIKKWVQDPNMRILRPDETTRLFQMKSDMSNDQPIKLPFIAISREREVEILNVQKQVKTFDGFTHSSNEKYTMSINVVPICIRYQIDIYTKGMAEADEYVRNFVFNFINFPKLKVEVPYNDSHFEHLSNIYLDDRVIDNSDIKERLFPDQFTRFTLNISVDDAYIFSLPIRENSEIVYADLEIDDEDDEDIGDGDIEVVVNEENEN